MKYRILSLSIAVILSGCSTVHYTSDLSKIRNEYQSAANQKKLEMIDKMRQSKIGFDRPTAYAEGIKCLSEPLVKKVTDTMAIRESNAFSEQMNAISQIENLRKEIHKIRYLGGYVQEHTTYQRDNQGRFYVREDGTIDPSTLQIVTDRIYPKSINQLALDINQLDYQIETRPKNLSSLVQKRQQYAFEFEDLKNELDKKRKELAEAEKAQEEAGKTLGNISSEKSEVEDVFKMSVANIYDKTGKVFPEKSTAISEMVAHALSYNYGVKLVDIPFDEYWNTSRANPIQLNENKETLKQSPSLLSPSTGFAGVVFPADMYISGALVQYDEIPATKPFGTRISVNIDPFDASTETRTINVGMILRVVGANSRILDNSNPKERESGERASVYVQNTYFVKKIGANIFEVKSRRLYGGNITVEVADPATYVVKEMTEAGVYELFKKMLRPTEISKEQKEQCDALVRDRLI